MKYANPIGPARRVKQDWERLYRAAVFESHPGKLLQRVRDAEAAILERFESLHGWSRNDGKERDALTRAQYILSMLRQGGQEP